MSGKVIMKVLRYLIECLVFTGMFLYLYPCTHSHNALYISLSALITKSVTSSTAVNVYYYKIKAHHTYIITALNIISIREFNQKKVTKFGKLIN